MNRRKLFQLLGTLGAWSASPAQAHRDFLKIDTAFAIPRLEDAWNMSDGNSSVSITWDNHNKLIDGWSQIKVIGIGERGQLFANHLVQSEFKFFDCCKPITSFEDFRSNASGTHLLFLAVDSAIPRDLKIADFIARSCEILDIPLLTLIDVGTQTNRPKALFEFKLPVDDVRALESFSSLTCGIAKILNTAGLVGIDFDDVRRVLAECGIDSRLGFGSASGFDRAKNAALQTLSSAQSRGPFRPDSNGTLLLIGAFYDDGTARRSPAPTPSIGLSYSEVKFVVDFVRQKAHLNADAHFVYGTYSDESLGDSVHVTLITSR